MNEETRLVHADNSFRDSTRELEASSMQSATPSLVQPHVPSVPVLSKNAQKRAAKEAFWREKKEEYAEKRRKKRKDEREVKKARRRAEMEHVSEEEKLRIREAVKRQREVMLEAHQNGTRLVIDLQWYGLMKSTEAKSAVQQIVHSYSVNAHCAAPFQLWLSSYREEYFAHLSGRNGWKLHRTEASVLDHFLSEKDRLVYLSADAEEDLTNIDKDAIYIIGGFVDRNRHKGITDTWAKEHGIRTVRFPISNLSVVLTINQVVAIMCEVNSDGDWQRALDVAVPKRKVLAQGEDHIAASQTLQSDFIHGSDVEDGVNDILDNDSDSLSGSEL